MVSVPSFALIFSSAFLTGSSLFFAFLFSAQASPFDAHFSILCSLFYMDSLFHSSYLSERLFSASLANVGLFQVSMAAHI